MDANPLPPLGHIFVCNMIPISFSPSHLTTYLTNNINNIQSFQDNQTVAFNETKSIELDSKKININNNIIIKSNSSRLAKLIYDFISLNRSLTVIFVSYCFY